MDLAWSERNPSGLALGRLVDRKLVVAEAEYLTTDMELARWIRSRAHGPSLIAIDAPIIAPNPAGTAREADRLMTRRFGRFHAGVYPANRERCARPIRLSRKLEQMGFTPNPEMHPGPAARLQLEFYPHSSLVALLGLPRIIKYKKGPVAARQHGLRQLQNAIRRLGLLEPRLEPSPVLRSLLEANPSNLAGRSLKRLEDQLDALLLSYLAAYYWCWGLSRCEVLGDQRGGYIVTVRLTEASFTHANA